MSALQLGVGGGGGGGGGGDAVYLCSAPCIYIPAEDAAPMMETHMPLPGACNDTSHDVFVIFYQCGDVGRMTAPSRYIDLMSASWLNRDLILTC